MDRSNNNQETVVKTKYGMVQGVESDGILKWFGVPYAKPPVGELRFKRAEQCEPWKGIRRTDKFSSIPYQYRGSPRKKPEESEDCLYANVWAPKGAKHLPVFVWIYGGGNFSGHASELKYDGMSFAKHDVIFVNYNYRVGPLGFYDFSGYDSQFESNCGLSDQIAGLKWVKENIEAFGGDPDNITIAGESAGGTAIYNIMAAPSAKGLFHKAIAESGLPDATAYPDTVKLNMELFLHQMGLKPGEVHKLKSLDPKEMHKAAVWVQNNNCSLYPGIFLPGPVIDDLQPEKPWDAMAKGSASGIDVIFGTTHDEATMFTMLFKQFPNKWNQIEEMLKINGYAGNIPQFRKIYGGMKESAAAAAVSTDRAWWVDYVRCADAQSIHGRVYTYRFDFEYTLLKLAGLGAMHGAEMSHVLNASDSGSNMAQKFTSKKKIDELTHYGHHAWINFAKTGNPNGTLPLTWEEYDAINRKTLIFDYPCRMVEQPNQERFELWKDITLYT